MKNYCRRILSVTVTLALLASLPVSVGAEAPETTPMESCTFQTESVETTAEAAEPTETADATVPAEETAVPSEETPAETEAPTQPGDSVDQTEPSAPVTLPLEETTPPDTLDATASTDDPAEVSLPWNFYFGQLHAHTELSDGEGSVEDAFLYASRAEHLDFFAVTDHSDSFDHAREGRINLDGSVVSEKWARGKAAAAAVTNETFVGIFGYELSWPEECHLGHLNTFGTPGWEAADVHGSLEDYYKKLAAVPGSVSQFNHPGPAYGDFENFGCYSAAYDESLCLLEVVGEGRFTAYDFYTNALDQGWHVAPTTSQNNHHGRWGTERQDRTVVLAKELTEPALYDAMKKHRLYASADGDLTVYYRLNGHLMGTVLGAVEHPEITVYLSDPTDDCIGMVEVIVDGGTVAASAYVDGSEDSLTLCPDGGYRYYYLRITQPDGDITVTAPVWTESYDDLGISRFTADTLTPIQGQELELSATLYSNEYVDWDIEKIEFFLNSQLIHSTDTAGSLTYPEQFDYSFPWIWDGLGTADLRVQVTGAVAGQPLIRSEELTLQFLPKQLVTGILVDGSHGGDLSLDHFTTLASQANMEVTIFSGAMPAGGEILLIPAPRTALDGDFLSAVRSFAESGGTIVLCGRSDQDDDVIHTAAQLNRLLEALDATLRFHDNTAMDPDNGGANLYRTTCNPDWLPDLTSAQVFAHLDGCTVDPGHGIWLIRGADNAQTADLDQDGLQGWGTTLLALEQTPWGGTICAAGSNFLSDRAMPLPQNRWAAPRVNQSILENLLNIKRVQLPLSTIQSVRMETPGVVCRVLGHVTAGTSNPCTTFPETIYLQDATGGIAVVPFRTPGIQIGTSLDLTGYLTAEAGMPVLRLLNYDILEEDLYNYTPKTVRNQTAMDYKANGGRLMQVEGTVTELTLTANGQGISRLTLVDYLGEEAEILIEDFIRSGASGDNELAAQICPDRLVRAIGLCHLDETGKTVLRVRDCQEVAYIPPLKTLPGENPRTGDNFPWPVWTVMTGALP